MKRIFLLLVLALTMPLAAFAENNPKADEKAQVVVGNARFTVLTSQMIRMEWSEDGMFEDRATLTFVNRKLEVPQFKVKQTKSKVTITTSNVTLTYLKGAKFSAENLSAEILVAGKKVVWHYGDTDTQNLMGTTRTLDRYYGSQDKLYGMQGIVNRCIALTAEFKEEYAAKYDPYPLLPDFYMNVSQAPNFIMEFPQDVHKSVDNYHKSLAECLVEIDKMDKFTEEFRVRIKAQLTKQ